MIGSNTMRPKTIIGNYLFALQPIKYCTHAKTGRQQITSWNKSLYVEEHTYVTLHPIFLGTQLSPFEVYIGNCEVIGDLKLSVSNVAPFVCKQEELHLVQGGKDLSDDCVISSESYFLVVKQT